MKRRRHTPEQIVRKLREVERENARLKRIVAYEELDIDALEARVLIEDWRIEYNTKRPHSSLGWLAPAAYAEQWEAQLHAGLS